MILPYVLSRTYRDDAIEFNEDIFDTCRNGSWRYLLIKRKGVGFFVSLNYVGKSHSFILFMFMATDKETADRYTVKLILEEDCGESPSQEKRMYEKQVLSIEEFKKFEDIPDSKCIRLNQSDAKKFFVLTKNADDEYSTVHMPIQVFSIKMKDD